MNINKISNKLIAQINSVSIVQQQLGFDEKPLEQNKDFMTKLFTSQIENAFMWFDKLDCTVSFARQLEPDMSLENFLNGLGQNSFIKLQIGTPIPDVIKFCAFYTSFSNPNIEHFAWFECPLTQKTFNIVNDLYKAAYGYDVLT